MQFPPRTSSHSSFSNTLTDKMKTSLISSLLLAPLARACWPEAEGSEIEFSTVSGYFMQDEPTTDPSTFDYVRPPYQLRMRQSN